MAESGVADALRPLIGSSTEVGSLRVEPVPYLSGSSATDSLQRVTGRTADGSSWSAFVELPEDRVAVWTEDVETRRVEWDLPPSSGPRSCSVGGTRARPRPRCSR